jgi:hypothetical protein
MVRSIWDVYGKRLQDYYEAVRCCENPPPAASSQPDAPLDEEALLDIRKMFNEGIQKV